MMATIRLCSSTITTNAFVSSTIFLGIGTLTLTTHGLLLPIFGLYLHSKVNSKLVEKVSFAKTAL